MFKIILEACQEQLIHHYFFPNEFFFLLQISKHIMSLLDLVVTVILQEEIGNFELRHPKKSSR